MYQGAHEPCSDGLGVQQKCLFRKYKVIVNFVSLFVSRMEMFLSQRTRERACHDLRSPNRRTHKKFLGGEEVPFCCHSVVSPCEESHSVSQVSTPSIL